MRANFTSSQDAPPAAPPRRRRSAAVRPPDILENPCALVRALEQFSLGLFYARGTRDLVITRANAECARMFEIAHPGDLVGMSLRDGFEDPERFRGLLRDLRDTGCAKARDVELESRRGRRFVADVSLCRDPACGIVAGVLEDVTEQARKNREFEHFFEHAFDMICVAGADGYFKFVNSAFERTLGIPREELLARPFVAFVHPDDVAATIAETARLSRGTPTAYFENRYRCSNGDFKHIEWTATPMPDGTIYATARDTTERHRAERAERSLVTTQHEIKVASEIQRLLLPTRNPSIAGIEVGACIHSLEDAGGDYYDFIPMADGRWVFVVADVMGHGIVPSLVMTQLRTSLWSVVAHSADATEIVPRVNDVLFRGTPDGLFVTAVLLEVDPERRLLRYASCGHPPAFILDRDGEIKHRLESTSLPLAVFEDCRSAPWQDYALAPGDLVVAVTDGVLEAPVLSGEPFGEDRMLDAVRANARRPATEIAEALYASILDHCPKVSDDITALVLKVQR